MASVSNKRFVDPAANDDADAIATHSKHVASAGVDDQAAFEFSKIVGAVDGLYARGARLAQGTIDDLPANIADAGVVGERLLLRSRQRLDVGVRRQPVEALLLAGAIGYLVGWATIRG